ncbi:hypothetical protein [Peterkaempfera bronchialis]|uniref:Lipoprotein n=1 Tax=Peterkaempfera bronchialis TaxID=2126346 RepID=A0A345SV78_9ACTN|nr:hypothetical protein [Peterkaempfera bronchialis]AXI77633.1 hypothetical protein C7M71_009445 [Peterkaempfera bronchialis]
MDATHIDRSTVPTGPPAGRHRAAAGLLAALLSMGALTACGSAAPSEVSPGVDPPTTTPSGRITAPPSAPPTTPPSAAPAGPHRVASGLDYLHAAVGLSGGADAVLTTPQQARRYPGWFDRSGERTVAAQLRARLDRPGTVHPAPGQALVAVVGTAGCGQPRSAELWADGSDLTVRWTGAATVPPECLAPFKAVAVFRVAAAALPEHPTVEGRQPSPAGP